MGPNSVLRYLNLSDKAVIHPMEGFPPAKVSVSVHREIHCSIISSLHCMTRCWKNSELEGKARCRRYYLPVFCLHFPIPQ